jgi:hypothetical protein
MSPGDTTALRVSPSNIASLVRYATRTAVWPSRAYLTLAGRRHRMNDALVLRDDTDLVIEGFPRSGNTFAAVAFELAQHRPVKVAHHLHAPAQVLEAVRRGVPSLLLIRDPLETVVSQLVYREFDISARVSLWSWVRFYRSLRKVRDRIVVADLRDVSSDFGAVIHRVNDRYRTRFVEFEHSQANVEAAFEAIDSLSRSRYGRLREDRVARPIDRGAEQARARQELMSASLARQRAGAMTLYRWWIS